MATLDTKHLRELAEAATPDGELGTYTFKGTRRLREFQYEVGPSTLIALLDEIERLRHWKAEAMQVHTEWEETWVAAGRPGRLGTSKAVGVRDEIERLRGDTEWEYAVRNLSTGEVFEPVNGKWWRTTDNEEPVRRRKAGPWEPVEGEGS